MSVDDELLYEVFDLLTKAWVEGVEAPTRIIGMQGDSIIIFRKGGEHVGLTLVPVTLGGAGA